MISLGLQRMPDNLPSQGEDRTSLYERDLFAWTQQQAARLRACAYTDEASGIDWDNVAEEIQSLGRRDRRELASRMAVLLAHLLKWRFQPEARSSGWRGTIREQRRGLARILSESPSLRSAVGEVVQDEYAFARENATEETGLPESAFPLACPFTVEDILDPAFLPEAA